MLGMLPSLPDFSKIQEMAEKLQTNFAELVDSVKEIQATQKEILRRLDEMEDE